MHKYPEWEMVIGLEVHIQLLTKTKLFSGASTQYGAAPNTLTSPTDLAMPGTLPVLNQEAVKMAILFGLSIHANLAKETAFARKHYFYPDLPKGYQISQHEYPIVGDGGYLCIDTETQVGKKIRITRAHLEEDAGKLLHEEDFMIDSDRKMSGIDLNRAGVPLLEIVSEPDLRSAEEAVSFLKTLHKLVRYLGICDGNMQEGSFRCDANVSVRKKGQTQLGTRAELKNLNSFRFIEKAINFECVRQIEAIEQGKLLHTETRLYDPTKNETRRLRAKETEADYRYFPDPDLCAIPLTQHLINSVAKTLPELPEAKTLRFQEQYHLNDYDTNILVSEIALADYFEAVVQEKVDPKIAANWINGELAGALNTHQLNILDVPVSAFRLAQLLHRLEKGVFSRASAKVIFEALWNGLDDIDKFIQQQNLSQMTDRQSIIKLVDTVLKNNTKQLEAYYHGKTKLFDFFVGQAMQISRGRCDPEKLREILTEKLNIST